MARTFDLHFGFGGNPSPFQIRYGTAMGGSAAAAQALLNPYIVRTYTGGALNTVNPGIKINHSLKPSNALADTTNANYSNQVTTMRNGFSPMPDQPDMWATVRHEPENDIGAQQITGPQWAQMQVNFQRDVLDVLNATRQFPLRLCCIMQGVTYTTGDPTPWLPKSLTDVLIAKNGAVGVDLYNSAVLQAAVNFLSPIGVDWTIPEIGYSVAVDATDAQMLGRLQSNVNFLNNLPAGSIMQGGQQPLWVMLFDSNHNTVTDGLTGAIGVGATSLTLNSGQLPDGIQVVLDANVPAKKETVTLSNKTTSGSNFQYTSTPTQFAHSNGAWIITRQQSEDFWAVLSAA